MPKRKAGHRTIKKIQRPFKKKSPRATIKCKDHNPRRHALQGSEDRRHVLCVDALALKIRGYELKEIAVALARKYDLEKTPDHTTVWDWIQEERAKLTLTNKAANDDYVATIKARAEATIKRLIPYLLDDFVVERTKVIGGMELPVIDENVLVERIKAAAEIRKQHELVMRAMGISTERGPKTEGSSEGMQAFILNLISNHIVAPGQTAKPERLAVTLEMEAGDKVLSALDAG